jgi:hypothetical protein
MAKWNTQAAHRLVAAHIAVIALEPRSKKPIGRGWQSKQLTTDDLAKSFDGEQNVGVLLGSASDGLVDVDLDNPIAVALAPRFLPNTGAIFGRASKPRSHWLYRVTDGATTKKFQSSDGAMIVEIRSDGAQTMFPPSIHPSGEEVTWDTDSEPAQVVASELLAPVERLTAVTQLAIAWPVQGSRQEAALALTGALIRGGLTQIEAADFVRAVADGAGDEESEARAATAEYSARRIASGEPATGWPKLAELLGEAPVRKARQWLHADEAAMESASLPRVAPWPQPLGEVAYHGLAGSFVRLVSPHSEADPTALLAQFLVAFGNVIGRGPRFRAEADRHHANLFVVLVGETSKGRKGVSWGQTRAPFRAVDEQWAKQIASGLSSGEGLIFAVRDAERDAASKKKPDPGVTDKRLLVFQGEFASVLSVMDREGSTLSSVLRLAWDTGDLRIMTKNSPIEATGAHISIIGHITIEELRRKLGRTELANGFANRILWLGVRRSKTLPDGGNLQVADMVPFIKELYLAIEFAKRLGAVELQRDRAARQLWHEVYPKLSEGSPGMFGAVTSRAEAQVMRLALLYALLDRSQTICRAHLEAALEVWRYAEESARFIWGDRLGDQDVDDLLAAIRLAPNGLTRSEISDAVFGHHRSADQIERALGVLQRLGLVRCVIEQTIGRPAERWIATSGLPVPSHTSLTSPDGPAVHPDEQEFAKEANYAKKPSAHEDCLACSAELPCWEHKPPF